MAARPRFVHLLQRATRQAASELAVARANEVDDGRVERRGACALVVEHGHEKRMLVGPAGERVEKELEPDVVRRLADCTHEGEVGSSEGDGIVGVFEHHLSAGGDRADVVFGVTLGRERHGLGGKDAPNLERAAHEIVPRRVRHLETADERSERLEAGPFAPRGDDGAGPVAGRDEAERLEARKGRSQRESVDSESQRELALGGQARTRAQAPCQDVAAQPVRDGIDHALPGDRGNGGQCLNRIGRRERRSRRQRIVGHRYSSIG